MYKNCWGITIYKCISITPQNGSLPSYIYLYIHTHVYIYRYLDISCRWTRDDSKIANVGKWQHRPQIRCPSENSQKHLCVFFVLLILGSQEAAPALGCGLNAERWLSKHELVREARVSRGKWRAQTVIRQVRKAERGQRSKKWGEMSSIDRRRWLHYGSRWTHSEFTKAFLTHVWEPVYPDNDKKKVLVIVIRLPETPMLAYWFWNVPVLHNSEHSASLHELMRTAKTSLPENVEKVLSDQEGLWENEEGGKRKTKWPFVSDAPDSPVLINLVRGRQCFTPNIKCF